MISLLAFALLTLSMAFLFGAIFVWQWGKIEVRYMSKMDEKRPFHHLLQNVIHDVASSVESIWFKLENLSAAAFEDEGSWRQQQDSIFQDITNLAQLSKDAKFFLQPTFSQGNKVRELINPYSLCEDVIHVLGKRARTEGVRLIYAGMRHPPSVWIDSSQIRRVLLNLIDNGIKYADLSKEEPKVVISTQVNDQTVSVSVSDNGIGIPKNQIDTIWEAAFRPQTAQNFHVLGTGLGLAIAKELTEANRGQIEVQSVLGQGTIFTVHLPIDRDESLK